MGSITNKSSDYYYFLSASENIFIDLRENHWSTWDGTCNLLVSGMMDAPTNWAAQPGQVIISRRHLKYLTHNMNSVTSACTSYLLVSLVISIAYVGFWGLLVLSKALCLIIIQNSPIKRKETLILNTFIVIILSSFILILFYKSL